MTDGRFLVRLELRLRDSGACRVGYLYPARRFARGEHAEQFGMCLWSTRHPDAVAVHVFPPVGDRRLAPDGWSIAEPIHVDCGDLSGRAVPAVTVVPAAKTDPAPAGAPRPDRAVAVCYSAACSASATP